MEQIGERITELGLTVIPYSFAFYLPTRWLEYHWKLGYTSAVKGFWYLALGFNYYTDNIGIDVLVMYICFIEAIDLFFQQKELNISRKIKLK